MNWILGLLGLAAIAEVSRAEVRGYERGRRDQTKEESQIRAELIQAQLSTSEWKERAEKAEAMVREQALADLALASLRVLRAVLNGQPKSEVDELIRLQSQAQAFAQQVGALHSQRGGGFPPVGFGGIFGGALGGLR